MHTHLERKKRGGGSFWDGRQGRLGASIQRGGRLVPHLSLSLALFLALYLHARQANGRERLCACVCVCVCVCVLAGVVLATRIMLRR